MPDIAEYDNEEAWMGACVPKMMDEGKDQDQAVAACSNMWGMKADAAKYRLSLTAIKAVGDWEVEIRAIPFNVPDSDRQTFDANTDYMLDAFSTPAILYQHGANPGLKGIQPHPVVIGRAVKVEQRTDGIYIRAILDQASEFARKVWEAAKQGMAVASSDSIVHLARLQLPDGRKIIYEKGRPGRIAVWPLAGVSVWDHVPGNFNPASRQAIALPAMKAIYREAGIPFPEVDVTDTSGVSPEAPKGAERRARVETVIHGIDEFLANLNHD